MSQNDLHDENNRPDPEALFQTLPFPVQKAFVANGGLRGRVNDRFSI